MKTQLHAMESEENTIESLERQRVRSLVEANIEIADYLHADDFELINPLGGRLTKDQYLGGIKSGDIKYLHWEPGEIEIRMYNRVAAIRYESRLEIKVFGQLIPSATYLHTDIYELRGGLWQVVWSQATKIAS